MKLLKIVIYQKRRHHCDSDHPITFQPNFFILISNVLIENGDKIVPANVFALLTGADNIPYMIQCAVFKGNSEEIFIDKRDFYGPIQEQLEEACNLLKIIFI